MDNIKECTTCGKTIIADEEFIHKCASDLIDIPVSSFFTHGEGDQKVAIGFGINGKSYRFVKCLTPEVKRLNEDQSNPEDDNGTKRLRIKITGGTKT